MVAWEALVAVVAESFGMRLGEEAEPLALATELSSPEAEAAWQGLVKEHGLAVPSLAELLGNSAVFTDVMVGGPAMGDQQSQEGGYNASLKNKAEAAEGAAQDDGTGLMAVGPLMSSVRLRQSGFVEMLSSEKSMVSRQEIAAIWVAFFSRCQRHRC